MGSLAPEVSLGYGAASNRALSAAEKVDICNATERERIAFGKVGPAGAGWGRHGRMLGWAQEGAGRLAGWLGLGLALAETGRGAFVTEM